MIRMISLTPDTTALIIVDMLNDFVKEKGTLVVPVAIDLVSRQRRIVEEARKKGFLVVFITDHHLPNDPEFDIWPAHAVKGTWGAEVIEELSPRNNEYVVNKRRYSGFFGTDLDLILRENDIETIVLVGVLTNICVMYTSADASAREYHVIAIEDATGTMDDKTHEFALEQMRSVHDAQILTTEQLLSVM